MAEITGSEIMGCSLKEQLNGFSFFENISQQGSQAVLAEWLREPVAIGLLRVMHKSFFCSSSRKLKISGELLRT